MCNLSILFIFAPNYQIDMFKRKQFDELKSRITEPRNKIQVISGPRQVGKSTMVKQVLAESTIPHLLLTADNLSLIHI